MREGITTRGMLSTLNTALNWYKINVQCCRNGKGDVKRTVELLSVESGCEKNPFFCLGPGVVFREC